MKGSEGSCHRKRYADNASGQTRSCFLDETQRNMKAPSYAEAQTDIGSFKNLQWESDGVPCDACLLHLEKLRMKCLGLKEENKRLMSQMHSISDWMRLAEKVKLSSDKTMAVAGFLSLCSSTNQVHKAAAEKDSLRPEAFHNHEDSNLAVISTTLSEQIERSEKEWKILAGMYNELVERIQQSERMLSDVRSRNFQLEIMNAELLNLVSYSQSSSQELQGFPSFNQMMHQASPTSNLQVPMPAECMDRKIPAFGPEIHKGSLYSSPVCTSEQKMDIVCEENNSGSVYASPVSVLGQSFDNEYVQDSAYESPAYNLRERSHAIRSREEVAYSGGDGDEHWRPDFFHAQQIQSPAEAASTECISAMLCERDEFPVGALAGEKSARAPLKCSNSAVMASKCWLTSIFDASLHLSEKQGCNNWSSLADHAPDLHPPRQHAFPHSFHKHYNHV